MVSSMMIDFGKEYSFKLLLLIELSALRHRILSHEKANHPSRKAGIVHTTLCTNVFFQQPE
jgi:hypothetical protein